MLCRSEVEVDKGSRQKIALFTNVEERAVVPLADASSIYAIPRNLQAFGLDSLVVEKFGLDTSPADLSDWDKVVEMQQDKNASVRIAMVGKYMELIDAYKSINEALEHAGIHNRAKVSIDYIDSENVEKDGVSLLDNADAILVPGGFGKRGIDGKIAAVRYARENNIPYLGICLGMQVAIIEYARNVLGLAGANSTEFDNESSDPVIALITEWIESDGNVQTRDQETDLGGSMRLGSQQCHLDSESLSRKLYGQDCIHERHRHRFELNNNYLEKLREGGLLIAGWSADKTLVEMIEIPNHPWFIACQFHPEFTSTPRDGHPLFEGFVRAAVEHQSKTQ